MSGGDKQINNKTSGVYTRSWVDPPQGASSEELVEFAQNLKILKFKSQKLKKSVCTKFKNSEIQKSKIEKFKSQKKGNSEFHSNLELFGSWFKRQILWFTKYKLSNRITFLWRFSRYWLELWRNIKSNLIKCRCVS